MCNLDKDTRLKIEDFSAARFMNDDRGTNHFSAPETLRNYRAPELWDENPTKHKSALGVFGCIIYELVTKRLPFDDRDASEIERQVRSGSLPEIPELSNSRSGKQDDCSPSSLKNCR